MRKRCEKGKSCGASCISRSKFCLKDLPNGGMGLGKLSGTVDLMSKPPSSSLAGDDLEKVRDVLEYLSKVKTESIDGEIKADSVNWMAGLGKGADFVASGRFGAFVEVPPESLAKGLEGRFPGGVGIKYGTVTQHEVEMLKKVGESGGGPRLIAAKVTDVRDSKWPYPDEKGMVAMERIPGQTLRSLYDAGKMKLEELEDNYLKGIAQLHRAGVRHGDAHLGNAILQPDGKVKFVDFGYAKLDYREALNEALKGVSDYSGPSWKFAPLDSPIAEKIRANLQAIKAELREYKNGMHTVEQSSALAKNILEKMYEGV